MRFLAVDWNKFRNLKVITIRLDGDCHEIREEILPQNTLKSPNFLFMCFSVLSVVEKNYRVIEMAI